MIKQDLQNAQIEAMKAKDAFKLQTIRYILAQIKNKEIDLHKELEDQEIVDVIRKEAKKLQESITAFTEGGRAELAQESQGQLDIIASYLPAELSDEDLKKKVEELIAQNQELLKNNPPALIGICVGKLKNVADASRIAQMVKSVIS